MEIPVAGSFGGDRATLGSRLAASIVRRRFGEPGDDPLLVLKRASGERPEAAEALAAFLDASSLEPLRHYLRDTGVDDADARSRAAAIDAFVLGVSTRRRVLRSEPGDPPISRPGRPLSSASPTARELSGRAVGSVRERPFPGRAAEDASAVPGLRHLPATTGPT
ncbi:hypothetical protein NMG29_39610 [Streptomyces cocklensis]|uniref:Tetracyclin repressor-like C-terminal domain-containing protein n=1 Tax=Actinacidiphila cocklensis TaxID=887465 RepID=A0A9W4E367_9ACTN|nr:hypothetical protein [Actinacidiphila cocklensis]MDD1064180.1 hypothetical protein [Actinacidiphila cocklensis]WSX75560.1 hypothetical protein OH826_17735 [Streptomyces sp. NBC_00899]CAG6398602.1 hypothetical protein SCOCK_700015 [Actinacidiphila cocklensis]